MDLYIVAMSDACAFISMLCFYHQNKKGNFFIFIFYNSGVRVSLQAPQLIPRHQSYRPGSKLKTKQNIVWTEHKGMIKSLDMINERARVYTS